MEIKIDDYTGRKMLHTTAEVVAITTIKGKYINENAKSGKQFVGLVLKAAVSEEGKNSDDAIIVASPKLVCETEGEGFKMVDGKPVLKSEFKSGTEVNVALEVIEVDGEQRVVGKIVLTNLNLSATASKLAKALEESNVKATANV